MTRSEIEEYIEVSAPDYSITLADGLDEAFIGLDTENEHPRAVYSIELCIQTLSTDMPEEEATEYFWYNVAGSLGQGYPLYISTPPKDTNKESPYS